MSTDNEYFPLGVVVHIAAKQPHKWAANQPKALKFLGIYICAVFKYGTEQTLYAHPVTVNLWPSCAV